MNDTTFKILFVVVGLIVITLAILNSAPSQTDIERCMKATNYSYDRCLHEIMR